MNYYKLFVFFVLFSLAQTKDCPSACNCTSTRRVDCVGVGVDAVSLNLDITLQDYNFTFNKVGVLNKGYFAHLIKAEYLLLEYNGITEVDEQAFHYNPELKRLDLAHNRIKYLPPSLLKHNSKLSQFFCTDNNLTNIDGELFKGLANLEIVMLQNNQIKTISPQAFISNLLLKRLYLDFNQLETAYWTWISHFNHSHHAYELYMDNNPWSCDCRMRDFKENLMTHKWPLNAHRNTQHSFNLPHCTNIPSKPEIETYDIANFTCSTPKLSSHLNCSNNLQGSKCEINFKAGQSGRLECSGEGKPIPKAQLSHYGLNITRLATGKVSKTWVSISTNYAGVYICTLRGYHEDGESVALTTEIVVTVESNAPPVVGIVLGITCAILIIAVIGFYYNKYKQRAGYGSLASRRDSDRILYQKEYPDENSVAEVTYLKKENADEEDQYDRNSINNEDNHDEKEVLV